MQAECCCVVRFKAIKNNRKVPLETHVRIRGNIRFSEKLVSIVFLQNPFWDSPFCLLADAVCMELRTPLKHYEDYTITFAHAKKQTVFVKTSEKASTNNTSITETNTEENIWYADSSLLWQKKSMMDLTELLIGENRSFYRLRISWKRFYWRNEKTCELLDKQKRTRLNGDGSRYDLAHPIASKNLF